jgi:FkbM family methyltransferase
VSRLRLRGIATPVYFRHGTTDKYVIAEVLVKQQYSCLKGMPGVETIVDAGANIGAASIYLLNLYPDARLVALEPDPENYRLLQKNLAPYSDRVTCLNMALWSSREELAVIHGGFRDGGEWSHHVRTRRPGDAICVGGTTMPELLERRSLRRIDILKIDIEGAEQFVFDGNATDWLKKVSSIAIELHDANCRDAFFNALVTLKYATSRFGEVTLCQLSPRAI